MPEMDGMRLVEWLHKAEPDIPIIMVTANGEIATALEAIRQGAYDYILKPFEKDQLYFSVQRALDIVSWSWRTARLPAQLGKSGRGTHRAARRTPSNSSNNPTTKHWKPWAAALDLKDAETEGHSKRVTASPSPSPRP